MNFSKMLAYALAALTIQGLSADNAEILRGGNHGKQHVATKKQNDKHDDCDDRDHDKNDKDCQTCHQSNRNEPNCPGRHDTLRIGIFEQSDPAPFTVLDLNTMTASGFDILLWCQLARCLNRQFEFIAFTSNTAARDAARALLAGDIDVIGTSVRHPNWVVSNIAPLTNFLINLECSSLTAQSVVWDEQYLSQAQFDTKKVTNETILTDLWKVDNLVFGTNAIDSKQYSDLRLAALSAGRSEEYFKSHIITNVNYSKDPVNYVTHFGAIGSDDAYQVLYIDQTEEFTHKLQKLQVCPWAFAGQKVDTSRTSIRSFVMPLQQEPLPAFGYLTRRDCCQFIRDAQECINALICDGTYFQICQIIAEQFPQEDNFFCECIPPLYASFFHGTVSRHCICCTFPNKPCEKRSTCEIPCNPTFTRFAGSTGR